MKISRTSKEGNVSSTIDPPEGKRKKPLVTTPSNTRGISCQEGGTGRKQEALTPKRPPTREPTRGISGGGVRKSKGKIMKMAIAMERWLASGKRQDLKERTGKDEDSKGLAGEETEEKEQEG